MSDRLEQAREKIRRNISESNSYPEEAQSRRDDLVWDWSTPTAISSVCGRFMISEQPRFTKTGIEPAWTLFKLEPGKPPFKIGGPYSTAFRARGAAFDYLRGEPVQLDLA